MEKNHEFPWIPLDSHGISSVLGELTTQSQDLTARSATRSVKSTCRRWLLCPETSGGFKSIWNIYIYYYIYENIWKSSIWIIMNIDES
jgi:hypothetical protein